MKNAKPTGIKTHEEREKYGLEQREVLKRNDLGLWIPPSNRRNPLASILSVCKGRIPELIPIRMARMAQSPHNFFRGCAPLMAADLAALPTTGMRVQMCGDAHVHNLGAYAAQDGHLVFDINDFDETYPGPWEWDLKRFATSLVLADEEAGGQHKDATRAILAFAGSYRQAMKIFAEMTMLELGRFEVRRRTQVGVIRAILGKAEVVTTKVTLEKLTTLKGGTRRFTENPPLVERVSKDVEKKILSGLKSYRETLAPNLQRVLDAYQPVDITFKAIGIGSVGTRVYVVLCLGRSTEDVLFIQFKEERPSCYAPYSKNTGVAQHNGKRVAEGQQLLHAHTDPFLGWSTIAGRHFLVRQLPERKASIEPDELKGDTLIEFGFVCGQIIAKAHARSGDAVAISAYCGESDKVDKALVQFAKAYARQSELDRKALQNAIKEGKVKAASRKAT